jgi:hypothetical protein
MYCFVPTEYWQELMEKQLEMHVIVGVYDSLIEKLSEIGK